MCKMINKNIENLAHCTNQTAQIIEKTTVAIHNDLSGRETNGCHPISAISSLSESLSALQSAITTLDKTINNPTTGLSKKVSDLTTLTGNHTTELADHERRIRALEGR